MDRSSMATQNNRYFREKSFSLCVGRVAPPFSAVHRNGYRGVTSWVREVFAGCDEEELVGTNGRKLDKEIIY